VRKRFASLANGIVLRLAGLWWLRVLLIWLFTRITSYCLFLATAATQGDNYWTKAQPEYFDFLNIWDAEWFERIYESGYPTVLPTDENGLVKENHWAFMAGFPLLVRLANLATGLEFKFAAPLVATLAGFGFALVLYKLLRLRFNDASASWAVLLIGLSPAAPVFQVGYAESLGMLFLAAALYWWLTDRLWLATIALAAMSITRPGAVAFGFAVLLAAAVVAWRDRRMPDSRQLVFGAGATALGFLWLTMAWLATGRFDAYLATEIAWRRGYTGNTELALFESWFVSAEFWFGSPTGSFIVLGLFGFAIWALTTPSARALGLRLWAWTFGYLLYLAAVFFPQSSTVRILLPAFPLIAAFAESTYRSSRFTKAILVAVAVVLQFAWLMYCWRYQAPDFSPP